MKLLFVTLFVSLINYSYATNYYFSSASGNDSRSSSEAQNPSTPWKTINKLNSLFGSLKPGDQVLLKRGETFYGSITVRKSGTASAPIVIGAYGTGNNPVITSLVTLGGWSSQGKGIWQSNSTLGSSVNMVVINGVEYGMGRFPNKDAGNNGYLNFESHSGKTSITDKQLSSSTNWKGAELVIRPRHWILCRTTITGQSGNTLNYSSSPMKYEPFPGYGYFIQNSIKTLDRFGEWYYNPSSKKLSVDFGSGSPTSYSLQATTQGDLVSSSGFSYVLFQNLTFKGANISGFNIKGGTHIDVESCNILFCGQDGFTIKSHPGLKVQNCNISDVNNNGIDIETGDNAAIRGNTITNCYMIAGMGLNGEGMGIGININSSNAIVEFNAIRNTGYSGIYYNGSNIVIKNNLIDNFCNVKDDGGGVYSTRGSIVFKNRTVVGNIILNGQGTGYGTNMPNHLAAHGVYLDNNAGGTDFRNNTIANCSNNGFNIHNSFGMTMENNTVFNNKIQLNMVENADNVPVRNCVLSNNILFSKDGTQLVSMIISSKNDIRSFGKFDNNYYARPVNQSNIILARYNADNGGGGGTTQNFDLNGWKSKYGMDMHSKTSAKQLAARSNPDNYIRFEYNASNSNRSVSLNGVYVDVTGKIYLNSIVLPPYTSAVLIKSTGIIGNLMPTISLTSPLDKANFSARSSVQITAAATDDGSVAKVDFYNGSSFLGSAKTSPYSFTWNNVPPGNYQIIAKATDNGGLVTSSQAITISVSKPNSTPKVSLTSPSASAGYTGPASISITASATDADGSIARVDFYNGTTLLGSDNSSPYSFKWNNVAAGNYTITALATDNGGLTTKSTPVKITVTAPKAARGSSQQASAAGVPSASAVLATTTPGNSNDPQRIGGRFLSQSDLSKLANSKLSPNPAVKNIQIYFDGLQVHQKANLTIQNTLGAILKRYPVILSGDKLDVDISSLSNGIYIIDLSGENLKINKKFIKIGQ